MRNSSKSISPLPSLSKAENISCNSCKNTVTGISKLVLLVLVTYMNLPVTTILGLHCTIACIGYITAKLPWVPGEDHSHAYPF